MAQGRTLPRLPLLAHSPPHSPPPSLTQGMDHIALTHLLRRVTKIDSYKEVFCSDSAAPWLIAGESWGQLTTVVVEHCPGLNVHGFEIQREEATKAALRFRDSHTGVIIHVGMGLSEMPATAQVAVPAATPTHAHVVQVGDGGAGSGGADVEAVGGGTLTTTLVSSAEWADEEGIREFSYVVLDTEGHEASVIRGMHLEQERNQKRFPGVNSSQYIPLHSRLLPMAILPLAHNFFGETRF